MTTLNISLPDDLKRRFFEAFAGENKSAVVARLIEEAIERAGRERESQRAVKRVLARRGKAPVLSAAEFRHAREGLREA